MGHFWRSSVNESEVVILSWPIEEQSVLLNLLSGTSHALENEAVKILEAVFRLGQGTAEQILEAMGFAASEIDDELLTVVESALEGLATIDLTSKVSC